MEQFLLILTDDVTKVETVDSRESQEGRKRGQSPTRETRLREENALLG